MPTLRRGTWRLGELYFLAQFLDLTGLAAGLLSSIEQHFAAFTMLTVACSSLYDLFDIINRPQLIDPGRRPCNEDSPMLPFDEER